MLRRTVMFNKIVKKNKKKSLRQRVQSRPALPGRSGPSEGRSITERRTYATQRRTHACAHASIDGLIRRCLPRVRSFVVRSLHSSICTHPSVRVSRRTPAVGPSERSYQSDGRSIVCTRARLRRSLPSSSRAAGGPSGRSVGRFRSSVRSFIGPIDRRVSFHLRSFASAGPSDLLPAIR